MDTATPAILQALDRGFWPRLMGYLSAVRTPNPARVAELAGGGATLVTLSTAEAAHLISIGKSARSAAKSWLAGVPVLQAAPPRVAIPPSPNVFGGDPGQYEVGLLIRPTGPDGEPSPVEIPVVFSSACRGSVQECIDDLMDFADTIRSDTPGLNAYINQIIDNWLYGRGNILIPNWLVERIDEHNSGEE